MEEALEHIRARVAWCEAEGVEILCCPEAILGGLADYAPRPAQIAIDVERGQLDALLAPLASDTVTTILGFTEAGALRHLYNSAAVFHRGSVMGIYRKLHPAMRQSIYTAGDETPVFRVSGLTFGIVICNDSNYPEPARIMALQGASVLFVPTNNALPPEEGRRRRRRQECGHGSGSGEWLNGDPRGCGGSHVASRVVRIVRYSGSRRSGPAVGFELRGRAPGRRDRCDRAARVIGAVR